MARFKKGDVGRLCEVKWDDTGKTTEMIVEVEDGRNARVYDFSSSTLHHIQNDQIVEIGDFVTPNSVKTSRLCPKCKKG